MAFKYVLSILGLIVFSSQTFAKTYTFKELDTYDYTAMDRLVNKIVGENTIDEFEREPKVREALKLTLSRRDTDGKRGVLFNHLQSQLPETYFRLSVQKVTEEATSNAKDKSLSLEERATAFVILGNIMAEIQPHANDYKSVLEDVKKADIEMDNALKTYRLNKGMDTSGSPSKLAEHILEDSSKREASVQPQSRKTNPNEIFD